MGRAKQVPGTGTSDGKLTRERAEDMRFRRRRDMQANSINFPPVPRAKNEGEEEKESIRDRRDRGKQMQADCEWVKVRVQTQGLRCGPTQESDVPPGILACKLQTANGQHSPPKQINK